MKKYLVFALIGIALSIAGYRWHTNKPEQKINATVDQLFAAVEYSKLKYRQRDDVHDAIREVMAENVNFQGESPLPEGEISPDRLLGRLDFFHSVTTLREFTELDRSILISGSEAQVTRNCRIKFAAGKNFGDTQTWKLIFDLKLDETWRITAVRGERMSD